MDMWRGEGRVRCVEIVTWKPGNLHFHVKYDMGICKIDSQWEFAVCLRKLKQGLCVYLEGWDGEGDGREVKKGGGICIPMADSCQFDRKQQNYVKQLPFN